MLKSSAWPSLPATVLSDPVTDRRHGTGPADPLAVAQALAQRLQPLRAGTATPFFAALAELGALDVTLARTVEPHLDALGILGQAGRTVPTDSTWGVFAAEGPGLRLEAVPDPSGGRDGVLLRGTKPWCSLASELTHALVTAHRGDERVLVAVELELPGVTTHDDVWVARGMPDVPSGPVDFDDVPARTVGDPGWYLRRPGFAWGGIGVAACWWGGAVGLGRVLRGHVRSRPDSELLQAALGATVADLADAEDALADAAHRIDSPGADTVPEQEWVVLAQAVRSRVRRAAESVRARTVATIGPAPLTADPDVAARVADLELWLLQDHGERDLARLGRLAIDGGVAW